jgi:hypothetical protein
MVNYAQVETQFDQEPDYDYFASLLDELIGVPQEQHVVITDNNSHHHVVSDDEAQLLNGYPRQSEAEDDKESSKSSDRRPKDNKWTVYNLAIHTLAFAGVCLIVKGVYDLAK